MSVLCRCRSGFTFHYASTLSQPPAANKAGRSIYIPLCFYFIGVSGNFRLSHKQFTFHYASTLSITRICQKMENFIYIPLCFYFIIAVGLSCDLCHDIYIPLCFYFIETRYEKVNLFLIIYIPLCFYFITTVCRPSRRMNHLHSTMLLLYLKRVFNCACVLIIYIPLCFYFITLSGERYRVFTRFTFHYASTLSVVTTFTTYQLTEFTFHYASTLSLSAFSTSK